MMLILTRNIGESIIIGDDVKVKGESHGQIKIGIDEIGLWYVPAIPPWEYRKINVKNEITY